MKFIKIILLVISISISFIFISCEKEDLGYTIKDPPPLTSSSSAASYYEISYELNGGSFSSNVKTQYASDEEYTLPKPSKRDFLFIGWMDEDGNIQKDVTIPAGSFGNKKYSAVWDIFEYKYRDDGTAIVIKYSFPRNKAFIEIPEKVSFNGVEYIVTELGESLFEGTGELIVNGYFGSSSFTVDIPKTITKIDTNAFKDCTDVSIVVKDLSSKELKAFADNMIINEGNSHVADVIKCLRPAIGWSIYA